ncbi:hypothetical protein NDU88_006238 [Pleurodeles waltl]|uniref:Uncharacterized protein n=1 Tax=Pleurodeles waltl TaxID=8319 RepID=A0AAV7N6N2_PLEWA|nr:hypothetical protein NDU88_006238 [Pleurodeles waltl]
MPRLHKRDVWKTQGRTCGIEEVRVSWWKKKRTRRTAIRVGPKTRPDISRQRGPMNQRRGRRPELTPATLEEKRGLCRCVPLRRETRGGRKRGD